MHCNKNHDNRLYVALRRGKRVDMFEPASCFYGGIQYMRQQQCLMIGRTGVNMVISFLSFIIQPYADDDNVVVSNDVNDMLYASLKTSAEVVGSSHH